jgi:single-stranded-DNA-specific exonuclease
MVRAMFATIADVVPLIGNNRNIVKDGLKLLNEQKVDLPGIYALCSALKLIPNPDPCFAINEEDISFYVAPCGNAMGRMIDNGTEEAFKYLTHYDVYGEDGIRKIVETNQWRKELTVEQQNRLTSTAVSVLADNPKTTCMVLCLDGLHEGIMGINAAKVCEAYDMPAIVLTMAENGLYKGSARSVEGIHIKQALDQVSEFIFAHGGHAGAAGLSIHPDNLDDFVAAINKVVPKVCINKNSWKYDLEIAENEIADTYAELRKYAPYGEEFPAPVFRVNNYCLAKNYGKYYRYIGDNGISLNGTGSEAISFNLKEKYQKYGTPLNLNLVGTLGYSRYSKKPQIMINDLQPILKVQETGFLI